MNKIPSKDEIRAAVGEMVDFVKPTYGPAGNKVLLLNGNRLLVLDDGATIADAYKHHDPTINAILELVKGVARKTNRRVGDGTTGSLIFAQALLQHPDVDTKELLKGLQEVKEYLLTNSKKIKTQKELREIALMAYNDEACADLIAEIVYKVGPDGSVSLEESQNLETTSEIVPGIQFHTGYVSPYLTTNGVESIMNDSPILVTEKKITSTKDWLHLADGLLAKGEKSLIIIADDFDGESISTFVANWRSRKFFILAIKAPSFGKRRTELLDRICEMTGAHNVGLELGKFEETHLGRAKRIVATRDETTITQGTEKRGKDYGVAVIRVGGSTEEEMRGRKYKIEDAINATKVAMRSGVIRGGGETLAKITTSCHPLNEALLEPRRVLLSNGGDLREVYDPVEVPIASLESAVSIVILLNEIRGIIVE